MTPIPDMALTRRILGTAAGDPGRRAFQTGDAAVTYGELAGAAARYAKTLSAGKEHHPAVIPGDRGAETPSLLLGCLLARRPYAALEATTPALRRDQILTDIEESPDAPGLAYLMYTSGSTGRPKGVEVTRDNLDFFLNATYSLPPEPPGQAVWLTHAPWSFDLSVLPLWQGLGRGDRVVWLDTAPPVNFPRLAGEMAESGATCWVSTPSFARLWLADPGFGEKLLPRLSLFFFCGEVLEPGLVLSLLDRFPRAKIVNAYGPTEATVAAALTAIPRSLARKNDPLPVGRPLPGVSLAILGEDGGPLPEGQEGEIAIGGPGVARGYRGLPDLTRQRFFLREGLPWYRTGDMGYMAEGQLWFRGRRDLQVKRRGCRVELGDLEQNLLALPQVAAAAAALVGDRLLALAVPAPGAEAEPSALLRGLSARLPGYLMPSRIYLADALPLTPQGKIDRQKVGQLLEHHRKGGT